MQVERLPLVKDLVAHQAPYHRRGAKIFQLEVVRRRVLLLFSVRSIIEKEAFVNFSLLFFSQNGEAN